MIFLYTKHDLNKAMIGQLNTEIISQYNEHYAYTPEYRQYLVQLEKQEKIRLAKEEQTRAHQALLDQFTLTKTDQVFFAGDSLMQGLHCTAKAFCKKNLILKPLI